jgi:HEPN domain-containing protein
MANTEIVPKWFAKADAAFKFAKANLEEGKPFFSHICFHFQQGAEKYSKFWQDSKHRKRPRSF